MRAKQSKQIRRDRRGMAVVVIVVVLSVLGLAVAGSIRPVRQESDLAALRVQTVRAFYSAESGVIVLIGTMNASLESPDDGDEIALGGQLIRFDEIPDGAGDATITGFSGDARRRIRLSIE